MRPTTDHEPYSSSSSSSSSNSRNEYYLGGIIALLLQDQRTMSTKSVCSSQYMATDRHHSSDMSLNNIPKVICNHYTW